MFDGGEHFHQFISSSTTSLPIPTLSFPLHPNPSLSSFDSYAPPHHHHHHHSTTAKNSAVALIGPKYPLNLGLESDRSRDPWSNEEVLALLKVRSTMEIWFPDLTWEHVSRKLGELGFKRSGEECKNKFEEESTHFNTNHPRILSELDEFYHAHGHEQAQEQADVVDQEKVEEESRNTTAAAEKQQVGEKTKSSMYKRKRRQRREKLEMLKGFCEAVVKTMMAKQEELHQKLIHDIIKRDEEKIAREESWKAQEMDRFKAQIEIRSKEHKSAAERQATIILFLKQFASDNQDQHLNNNSNNHCDTPNSNSNSNSNSNCSASLCQIPQTNPNQNPTTETQTNSNPTSSIPISKPSDHDHDVGKRWPRDEVVALINLRCKMSSEGGSNSENPKGPLWERISQGMKEMGYKRNAKRCKEKWENINKYFRKTKDSSKKRSVNSRTCPYFHQLSCLYSDGTIVGPNLQMPETYISNATVTTTTAPPAS